MRLNLSTLCKNISAHLRLPFRLVHLLFSGSHHAQQLHFHGFSLPNLPYHLLISCLKDPLNRWETTLATHPFGIL